MTIHDHKSRWWFVIHAKEDVLATLDFEWSVVFDHTHWKLLPCYKPITDPSPESGNVLTNHTSNVIKSPDASNVASDNNDSLFLEATSGEAVNPQRVHVVD